MESDSKPKLLITGINGYIGIWTTLKALESGDYHVRGTVRDKNDKRKLEALKQALGIKFEELELVSADLSDKESLTKAAEGWEYILHMASPYPLESPKNEDEVIKPAVDGTVSILEAVKGTGVKRVVITSSCAAISDHTKGDIEIDETSWPSNVDELIPYYKSKILAEKAAWDFIENLGEDEKFELVTVNPGLVVGPLLIKGDGTSQKIFTEIMTGKMSSILQVYFPVVDVRDVADAHLKALTSTPFKRYAMVENTYYFPDLGTLMDEEFSKYGYKVTTGEMWKATIWLGSLFVDDAKDYLRIWRVRCHIKNDQAKKELGIKFRPIKDSLRDMGYSLIQHGFVPDLTQKKKK